MPADIVQRCRHTESGNVFVGAGPGACPVIRAGPRACPYIWAATGGRPYGAPRVIGVGDARDVAVDRQHHPRLRSLNPPLHIGAQRREVGSARARGHACGYRPTLPQSFRWASRHKPRGPFFMLWEGIRDVVPQCFGSDEDVLPRACAWITVYGSHYHLANRPGMRTSQWGSALAAEAPSPSWRRLVVLNGVLACHPPKLSRLDDAPRSIGSAVRLPANGTVAVAHKLEWPSDFVPDRPTQAASLYRHVQTSRGTSARANAPPVTNGRSRPSGATPCSATPHPRTRTCTRSRMSKSSRATERSVSHHFESTSHNTARCGPMSCRIGR